MNRRTLIGIVVLVPLIELVSRHSDDMLRGMARLSHVLEGWWWWFLNPLPRLARSALRPEVLSTFTFAVVLASAIAVLVASAHIAVAAIRKRKTRVFVSYHHDYEALANFIAGEMTRAGLNVTFLPFLTNRDHDQILEEIANAIRDCDVLVCLPGQQASFVESEVSMAFGLEKPVLFVSASDEVPTLPNTAKKGYPVFLLERLQERAFRPLIAMSSYLAHDWRSTIGLYSSVLNHLTACAGLNITAFLLLIVVFNYAPWSAGGGELPASLFTAPAMGLMAAVIAVMLIPYAIFVSTRFAFRYRLRRVVSGMKFADNLVPKTLGYSFFQNDLLSTLYRGQLLAHHETALPEPHEVRTDAHRGKPSSSEREMHIELVARSIHSGVCSLCNRARGSVDEHRAYRVWSAVIYTQHLEYKVISCRRCAIRAQMEGIIFSALLGWWGFWGLLYTPVQIVRNIAALVNPPDPTRPSGRLVQTVREELYGDAQQRKQRSEAALRAEGVPIDESLPAIESEREVRPRWTEDVAYRALSLLAIAAKGQGVERSIVEKVIEDFGLQTHFTSKERAFIGDESPSQHDRMQFSWRYESAWALLWALGHVEKLGRPTSTCDAPCLVQAMKAGGLKRFIEEGKLRPVPELLDEADRIYRYCWAVGDARINGRAPPAGLEPEVTCERNYALKWLIRRTDEDWDDVGTDV